jgi:AcrR family transcriptional regulator
VTRTAGRPVSAQPAAPGRRYAGKSLADRRSEQHERILAAARDTFATRGFANASIDEIVARARVSRSTFYVFFENKEECLLAVYRSGLERFGGEIAAAAAASAERGLDPQALLREEVRATLAAYAADPALARVVLIEIVGVSPAAEALHVRSRHVAARIIQTRLEEYEYGRRRPARHRRVASLAAMAAISESAGDLVASGRLDEWESLVEPLSEFLIRALVDPAELG